MSNNIPVNGWPQLKDLEAVQPILNRLDKIEAWKRTVKEETFTGDDITIENALALPARSLITEINAIQDLHGYDHPWVGGAGKNKLPMTVAGIKAANGGWSWSGNTGTFNGGTATILTDGDNNVVGIKVNGTFSAPCNLRLTATGNLGLNGYLLSGTVENAKVQAFDDTTLENIGDIGSGIIIPNSFVNYRVYIGFIATTYNNVIVYPQCEIGSTRTAFAPYSNICPISGRDSVVVTRSDGDEISEDFTIQLGTTVYGADINWDTGVMTVKTVCPDLGGLTWTADATGVANKNRFYADLSPLAVVADSVNLTSISSQYTLLAPGGTYSANADGYTITAASKIYIYDESLSSATAADFKTAMSGVQVEYTLVTPTTIQLTPTQLEMLKGYNHITLSDGYGTIELKALTGANWS